MTEKKTEYSVTEVAEKTGIPYYTVIRDIKRGKYPNARKVGHGWIIPAEDVK